LNAKALALPDGFYGVPSLRLDLTNWCKRDGEIYSLSMPGLEEGCKARITFIIRYPGRRISRLDSSFFPAQVLHPRNLFLGAGPASAGSDGVPLHGAHRPLSSYSYLV